MNSKPIKTGWTIFAIADEFGMMFDCFIYAGAFTLLDWGGGIVFSYHLETWCDTVDEKYYVQWQPGHYLIQNKLELDGQILWLDTTHGIMNVNMISWWGLAHGINIIMIW